LNSEAYQQMANINIIGVSDLLDTDNKKYRELEDQFIKDNKSEPKQATFTDEVNDAIKYILSNDKEHQSDDASSETSSVHSSVSSIKSFNRHVSSIDKAISIYDDKPIKETEDFDEYQQYYDSCIDMYAELKDQKIDVSHIPDFTKKKLSIKEIKSINRTLYKKYSRVRSQAFGAELIVQCAQGLETVFDGKRSLMGFTPNLTGLGVAIRPRLRRMRPEIAQITSELTEYFNIGQKTQLALELLTATIVHANTNTGTVKEIDKKKLALAIDDIQNL
jgi:hypothetical protein